MLNSSNNRNLFLICCLVSLTILALIFDLHGFSIGYWHTFLGGKLNEKALLGVPQGIRSDDWLTFIPLALSQLASEPPYQITNPNIGLGQNMLLPLTLPVFHFATIFRPTVWGFFLGPNVGLSWMWCFLLLGLIYSVYLLFMELSRNTFWLSLLGAVFLAFSAFFQFWSLNCATYVIYSSLMVVSSVKIIGVKLQDRIWPWAILLCWSIGCFLLSIYPPYQVTMVYVSAFIFAAIVFERHKQFRDIPWNRILVISLSVVLGIVTIIPFLLDVKDVFSIMNHTEYPGRRISHGGTLTIYDLLRGNLFPNQLITDWDGLATNESEVSSFIFLFPFLIPLLIFNSLLTKKISRSAIVILLAFIVLLTYGFVGIPESLSKLILLSYVPVPRSFIGLGVLDLALLVVTIRDLKSSPVKLSALLMALGVSTYIIFIAILSSKWLISFELRIIFCLLPAIVTSLLLSKFSKSSALILAILLIYTNGRFNPIMQGGSNLLYNSKFSQTVKKLNDAPGDYRWVVFDSLQLGPLLPVLGANTISTIYPYPQLDLWRFFDPEGTNSKFYNRYAYSIFFAAPEGPATFENPSPDSMIIRVNPKHPAFKALKVRYFIVGPASKPFFPVFDIGAPKSQ